MTFEEFIQEWKDETPYIVAKTSGSTGEPKNIRLSKIFVRKSACRTNKFFSIAENSRLHSCVAADYIGGKMMAVRALEAGCSFSHEIPTNRPLGMFRSDDHLSLVAVVPSQMLHILDNITEMPKMDAIIIGGSSIHPSLCKRIIQSGLNCYETYGMTETSSHIALRPIKEGEQWFDTLDGIRVRTDSRGCLVVNFESGESVVTNDLAEILTDRRFRIVGRWDHVIITGGKKVNPYSVEDKISGVIDAPFIITSYPDEKWGNKVVLRIEGIPTCMKEDILNNLKGFLEAWEMPKSIEWVESLPRTSNGKLKR